MVSSVLQPEKIIGKQKPTKEQALSFVSGGSSLGSSVLSGAKNKIVNFDRAKVSTKPNNLQALISNLSTSVFNTTNTIQNIFGNKETKEKKSSKFFGGFFDKFKEALAFITFFGAKKNLDRVKENIDNLKTTFTETFDVAKALRKAILKIIEQISGLSGGGGGGGLLGAIMSALGGLAAGLIPGMKEKRAPNVAGPAMKQEGNLLSKIPKGLKGGGGGIGKLLLGGTAALGVGSAVSGLSQPGGEDVQPGDTAPEVPGNVLDKFNSILDRFDKVLDGLGGGKRKKGSESGTGSKSSGSGGGGSGDGGGGGGGSPVDYSNLKSGDISTMAGKSAVLYDEYRNLGYTDEGAKRLIAEIGREGGMDNKNLFGTHTDPSAKTPNTGMFSWNKDRRTALIDQAKKAGVWDETKGQIKETAEGLRFQARFSANEINTRGAGVPEALTTPGYSGSKISELLRDKYVVYRTDRGYSGGPDSEYGSVKTGEWYKRLAPGLEKTYKAVPGAKVTPPKKTEEQKKPAVIVLPGQQQQQQPPPSGGGGKISASPAPKQNGPTVPFYPSTNYDNFLTLYPIVEYNIC
jgi:hypothetical protein